MASTSYLNAVSVVMIVFRNLVNANCRNDVPDTTLVSDVVN